MPVEFAVWQPCLPLGFSGNIPPAAWLWRWAGCSCCLRPSEGGALPAPVGLKLPCKPMVAASFKRPFADGTLAPDSGPCRRFSRQSVANLLAQRAKVTGSKTGANKGCMTNKPVRLMPPRSACEAGLRPMWSTEMSCRKTTACGLRLGLGGRESPQAGVPSREPLASGGTAGDSSERGVGLG